MVRFSIFLFLCTLAIGLLGCQDENDRGENGLSEKLNTQIEESEENGSWHQLFYQKINEVDSMYKKPSQKTKYWLALTQGYLTNKMPEEAEKSLLQALRWQKDYTDIDQQIENIAETLHINAKRKAISKTYYKVIVDYYPSSDFVTKAKDNLPEDMSSLQNQMEDLDEIIVKRLSENNELSPILIKDYISVAQLLTIFTDNIQAYTYLNKAAALSRGYGDINMAEVLYDWVILENPENAIAAKSLFEKGFMLDQSGFTENATITYNRFLQEYPDHQLASQVRILRDNVSESEEELLERLKSMKEDSDSLATQ